MQPRTNNLMTHIVAGYPTLQQCEEIIMAMAETGVKFIEIQFPFTDPIADGPTIMEANAVAIKNGVTTEDCFKLVEKVSKKIKTPIIIMTYSNILYQYGIEKFCRRAGGYNVYGLIVPDMPIDEEKNDHFLQYCKENMLHAIHVVSPITPEKRLVDIGKKATGFIYCVSRFGTTGEHQAQSIELDQYIKTVKKHVSLPCAIGFGITNLNQVQYALKYGEIAIIGSKIIDTINNSPKNAPASVRTFIHEVVRSASTHM